MSRFNRKAGPKESPKTVTEWQLWAFMAALRKSARNRANTVLRTHANPKAGF